jgi:hypothetical protein
LGLKAAKRSTQERHHQATSSAGATSSENQDEAIEGSADPQEVEAVAVESADKAGYKQAGESAKELADRLMIDTKTSIVQETTSGEDISASLADDSDMMCCATHLVYYYGHEMHIARSWIEVNGPYACFRAVLQHRVTSVTIGMHITLFRGTPHAHIDTGVQARRLQTLTKDIGALMLTEKQMPDGDHIHPIVWGDGPEYITFEMRIHRVLLFLNQEHPLYGTVCRAQVFLDAKSGGEGILRDGYGYHMSVDWVQGDARRVLECRPVAHVKYDPVVSNRHHPFAHGVNDLFHNLASKAKRWGIVDLCRCFRPPSDGQ